MAWIVFALDGTLLQPPQPMMDDGSGQPPLDDTSTGDMQLMSMPTDGAVEAVVQLLNEGHRVSVWTDRFAPMPEQRKQQLREEIEQELAQAGFPVDMMEVWTGTTKPSADIYIDRKAVTFDDDWGLALAQVDQMLMDQGLTGPIDDGSMANGYQEDPEAEPADQQPAEEEVEESPAPAPKKGAKK